MNPSFTGLPLTSAVTTAAPSSDANSLSIQTDGASSGAFNRVFEQFSGATVADAAGNSPENQALLAALQELPQGGKLLPLVQQTLDKVAAGGGDIKAFLAQLTAGLKQLAREQDRDSLPAGQTPAEQLALVLQPIVQEQPAVFGMLPAEVAAAVERQALQSDAVDPGRLPRANPLAVALTHKAADAGADPGPVDATASRDARPLGLDLSAFAQLQQQTGATANREPGTDLSVLMSALKRLAPDAGRPVGADATATPVATATAHATPATSAVPAALPTVAVHTPLGQADWDQALGERIQWLASQKVQGAQVKLNPANLGPMEVRIQVHNDQASVHFSAHHAVVREALEAALPRLRDMFEASGVQLVDVDVSSGSFSGRQETTESGSLPALAATAPADPESTLENAPQTTLAHFMASGRLDLFA